MSASIPWNSRHKLHTWHTKNDTEQVKIMENEDNSKFSCSVDNVHAYKVTLPSKCAFLNSRNVCLLLFLFPTLSFFNDFFNILLLCVLCAVSNSSKTTSFGLLSSHRRATVNEKETRRLSLEHIIIFCSMQNHSTLRLLCLYSGLWEMEFSLMLTSSPFRIHTKNRTRVFSHGFSTVILITCHFRNPLMLWAP